MKEQPKSIPLCYKCYSKMVQPDLFDKEALTVVGCKELTKKEWEKGYFADAGEGTPYQHFCPLLDKTKE